MQILTKCNKIHKEIHYLKKLPPTNQQLTKPKKKRQAGSLEGQIKLADDFDEPLADFKEYI